MQGISMNVTKAEAFALHAILWGNFPEDSAVVEAYGQTLKKFHVKLDVFLAVTTYGEKQTAQQLKLWDAEAEEAPDLGSDGLRSQSGTA